MKYKHSGQERRSVARQRVSMPILVKVLKGEGHTVNVPKKRKPQVRKSPYNNMVEKALERSIILFLQAHGCIVGKCGEQATYNSQYILVGIADLIVFNPTNKGLWFIECKSPDGKLRPAQVKFKELCAHMGINHLVARSLEDVRVVL